VKIGEGEMANLAEADLGSQLVDLTLVPLTELRDLTTSELVAALERTYAAAEHNTGNELQEQQA
jgi:hypothetical protein